MYVELLIIDGKPSRALHFFQLRETFQVMAVDQPGSSGENNYTDTEAQEQWPAGP